MSQKDLATFGNRFSAGRATAGSTYTTLNENVQVLGGLSVGGNFTSSGNFTNTGTTTLSSTAINNLNVNSGKTLIDSNGNIISLGNLSLAGVATMNNIYASGMNASSLGVTGTSTLSDLSAGNTSIGGTLGVTGASTLAALNAGNTSLSGTLNVTGASNLSSVNLTSANVNSGKLTVDSNGNVASLGNVSVGGVSTISSLSVIGVSNLNTANVAGDLNVTGNGSFNGYLMTGGIGYFNGINVNGGIFSVEYDGSLFASVINSTLGNVDILNVSGPTTHTGAVTFADTVNIQNGKFVVNSSGNTTASGSLDVTGAATMGSTLNVTGASNLSSLNVSGASAHTGAATFGSTVNVQSGKFVIDSSGNVTATGSLGVTGAATMSSTLNVGGAVSMNDTLAVGGVSNLASLNVSGVSAHTGASTFANTVNVQNGKFVIDSSGNVGIGSTPSGAVMDIYSNNSRIRMRGTGTGIEWNNNGSTVLSSMIYDSDSKIKMYSSATTNPKLSLDSNNVILINNPSATDLKTAKQTAITPVGILTVAGLYNVSASQSGGTMTLSGTDSSALLTYLGSNKAYLYIDDANYRNKLIFPSVSGGNLTLVDVLTGSTVSQSATLTNVNVYVASAVVTNAGAFLSATLVTNGNPQVVVSNQYGQLGVSA